MKPDYKRIEHLERVLFPELHRPKVTERDREIARAVRAYRRSLRKTPEGK